MRMAPLGLDNLVVVSDEARHAAYEVARRGGGGVDSKQVGVLWSRMSPGSLSCLP